MVFLEEKIKLKRKKFKYNRREIGGFFSFLKFNLIFLGEATLSWWFFIKLNMNSPYDLAILSIPRHLPR